MSTDFEKELDEFTKKHLKKLNDELPCGLGPQTVRNKKVVGYEVNRAIIAAAYWAKQFIEKEAGKVG